MAEIILTNDNFDNEVMKSDKPVLIDFWASWCGPCKMMSPIIDELADEVSTVKICKINVDEEPALAEKYEISSIPTLVLIKNGEVVTTSVGAIPKSEIVKMIEN